MNLSGPDLPAIQCRVPDGCCPPSPCDVTEELFICQVRALLPEGQVYNNTLVAEVPVAPQGALTPICDNKIGCEQLILGGCCESEIVCDDNPIAPQLALVDAFASVAYGAVAALCAALRELDPCTAEQTIRDWARRLGIVFDECDPRNEWSESTLALVICVWLRLRFEVWNWETLTRVAAFFGARMTSYYAGDMNCGPSGWWTMARDAAICPPKDACPEQPIRPFGELMSLVPACSGPLLSLNIVMEPSERIIPPNCNLPTVPSPQPHDPELYEVWKWLLPQILPPALWCIYERDDANCIVM